MAWLHAVVLGLTVFSLVPTLPGQARGTVKSDSLKVYRQMSLRGDVVTTLERGASVQIDELITGEGGTWCGISRIDRRASLGYVICDQLERERPKPEPAPSRAAVKSAPAVQSPAVTRAALTPAQMAWGLAASALLTEAGLGRHNTLALWNRTPEHIYRLQQMLHEQWGIQDRASLLVVLSSLDQGGHRQTFTEVGQRVAGLSEEEFREALATARGDQDETHWMRMARKYYPRLGGKSLVGWDYARYISICRWGYFLNYLSEEEAWHGIMHAARIIQSTFSSWRELGENYLIGREFWSYEQTQKDGRIMRQVCDTLLRDARSPWNRVSWNVDLGREEE